MDRGRCGGNETKIAWLLKTVFFVFYFCFAPGPSVTPGVDGIAWSGKPFFFPVFLVSGNDDQAELNQKRGFRFVTPGWDFWSSAKSKKQETRERRGEMRIRPWLANRYCGPTKKYVFLSNRILSKTY